MLECKPKMDDKKTLYTYTTQLTPEQADHLKALLEKHGYQLYEAPSALFMAKGQDTTVTVYKNCKLVVQGKGTEQLVKFLLEPEVLKEARLGYEELYHPEWFKPHIGIDESGKGDLFGPLCVAAVYIDGKTAHELLSIGITESKHVRSDRRLKELVDRISRTEGLVSEVVLIGNKAYNRLLDKFENLNRLLAWGHARALENLLKRLETQGKYPEFALSDQFAADIRVLKSALMPKGQTIEVFQRPRAESDPAVAAASLLARWAFLKHLSLLSTRWKISLPKGANVQAEEALKQFVLLHGTKHLSEVAKLNFSNVEKVLRSIKQLQGPEDETKP